MDPPPFYPSLSSRADAAFDSAIKRYQTAFESNLPPIVPTLHPADAFFNPTIPSLSIPPTCPLCSFTPTSSATLSIHISTAHPNAYRHPLPPLQQNHPTPSLQQAPHLTAPLPTLSSITPSQTPWHPLTSPQFHQPRNTGLTPPPQSDSLYCDTCNIQCETPAQKAAHVEGQKHRKRQQIASQFEQVIARLPQEGVREIANELWACVPCRLCLEGRLQVMQHLESVKHRRLRDETEKRLVPKRVREGAAQLEDEGIAEFLSAVMRENGGMEKDKGTNFSCNVCGVSCNSMDNLNAHLASAKHKKRQLIMEGNGEEAGKKGVVMQCKVCNISCSGAENFEAHMKGKPHAKKVKLFSGQLEGMECSDAANKDKA